MLNSFGREAVWSPCLCLPRHKLLKSFQSRGESYVKLIWVLWSVHRQQTLTYGADLFFMLGGVVRMKTWKADPGKVLKR